MISLYVPYYVLLNVPYTSDPTVSHMKNGSVGDLFELEKAIFEDVATLNSSFIALHIFRLLAQEFAKPVLERNISFANFMRFIDPTRTCHELLQTYAFLGGEWRKSPIGNQEFLFNKLMESAVRILDHVAGSVESV